MHGHGLDVRGRAAMLGLDGLLKFSIGTFHCRTIAHFCPPWPCGTPAWQEWLNSDLIGQMTKDEIINWAMANGWQMLDGAPSLTKPSAPHPAIVRLVLKATVASLEIKKPAGKWEKVASQSYSKIEADAQTGMPGGLGLSTISGLTLLMQDNKDRMVFSRMTKS